MDAFFEKIYNFLGKFIKSEKAMAFIRKVFSREIKKVGYEVKTKNKVKYFETQYKINPVTNINFSIPAAGNVKLTVFDMTGRETAVLVNGNYSAGTYKIDYDASSLASGVYFYKLETEGFTDVKKMMLIK